MYYSKFVRYLELATCKIYQWYLGAVNQLTENESMTVTKTRSFITKSQTLPYYIVKRVESMFPCWQNREFFLYLRLKHTQDAKIGIPPTLSLYVHVTHKSSNIHVNHAWTHSHTQVTEKTGPIMHECRVRTHTHTHRKVSHTNTQGCPCMQRRQRKLQAIWVFSWTRHSWKQGQSEKRVCQCVCGWKQEYMGRCNLILNTTL